MVVHIRIQYTHVYIIHTAAANISVASGFAATMHTQLKGMLDGSLLKYS